MAELNELVLTGRDDYLQQRGHARFPFWRRKIDLTLLLREIDNARLVGDREKCDGCQIGDLQEATRLTR